MAHVLAGIRINSKRIAQLRKYSQEPKTEIVAIFKDHCMIWAVDNVYYLLAPLCVDLAKFGNISCLDAVPYRQLDAF